MFTIATPFINRPRVIPIWLESFKRLDIPHHECKLLWVDRTGNPALSEKFKRYIADYGHLWKKVEYLESPPQKFPIVLEHLYDTLERATARNSAISETMNLILSKREGHLLLWEDDIVAPPNAFRRMREVLEGDDAVLGVTGVQYNRQPKNTNTLLMWNFFPINRRFPSDEADALKFLIVQVPSHKERLSGVENIDAAASGFTLFRDRFLENYKFGWANFARGYHAGHDIMSGFHINGFDKSKEGGLGKLALCWDLKFPHLGTDDIADTDEVRIFKSPLCQTEIPSVEGA